MKWLRGAALGMMAAIGLNSSIAITELSSASGNVVFGANITTNNACFILIRRAGTMVQNVTGTQLSSQFAGGQSGIADVFAIFPFAVSVDPPPFFTTSPPGGNNNVTFDSWFSGTALNAGGMNFALRDGTDPVQFPGFFGYTRLDLHLDANALDPLPAGTYQTVAIVRCE